MSNEKLVALIQQGKTKYCGELWQQVYKFICYKVKRVTTLYSDRMLEVGVTDEDIIQDCYFAMLDAVKLYNSNYKVKFTVYLSYHLKNVINSALAFRTAAGRNDLQAQGISLDETVGTDDNLLLSNTIPDEKAEQAISNVDEKLFNEQLHKDLQQAMSCNLDYWQRFCIKKYYYAGQTYEQISKQANISIWQVREYIKTGLRKLRYCKQLAEYRNEIISNGSFKGTGYTAFKSRHASSVEYAVEKLLDYDSFLNWSRQNG